MSNSKAVATTEPKPQSDKGAVSIRTTTVFDPNTVVTTDTAILEAGSAGDFSIALNYHEFQQDEPVRGFFLGITNYECTDRDTGELKSIPGAVFMTGKKVRGQFVKETRINCSVKFVQALRGMPMGFAFEATMTGRKSKGDKSIAQFHIVQLTAE
jgi:hypothetical protein